MGLLSGQIIYSFGLVFMYCELSEQIKMQFEEVNSTLYELNWYTCPMRVQRMMTMIVLMVQQPVDLMAFGGIPCSRQTFKSVHFTQYVQLHIPHCASISLILYFSYTGGERWILVF